MANLKKNIKAKLRVWTFSLLLVILFAFVMILFVVQFITITNPSNPVLTDTGGLNDTLETLSTPLVSFEELSRSTREIMGKTKPSLTDYLFLMARGFFDIPFGFLSFLVNGTNAIIHVVFSTFSGGILNFIFGIITSGMILTGIFYIIKAIRTGESDR